MSIFVKFYHKQILVMDSKKYYLINLRHVLMNVSRHKLISIINVNSFGVEFS
jgi:hypothetical protein